MRRAINNIISIIYTFIKFSLMKLFRWKTFVFKPIERFSPNVVTEFNRGSNISLGEKVRVHSGTKIKVRKDAQLIIGNNVKINYYCIIACHNSISIDEETEFGPSVYLYDHDHDYNDGLKSDQYQCAPIIIGKKCWIGANTIILRGTTIGNNCVIGAGSIVKGNIPDGSLFVQKKDAQIKQIIDSEGAKPKKTF